MGSLSSSKRMFFAASSSEDTIFSWPSRTPRHVKIMLPLFIWLLVSESARLIGLLGDILRGVALDGAVLRTLKRDLMLAFEPESAPNACESADGVCGEPGVCLGDFMVCR